MKRNMPKLAMLLAACSLVVSPVSQVWAAPEEQSTQGKEKEKGKVEVIDIANQAADAILLLGSNDDEKLGLTAVAKDKEGNIISDKKIHWKSSNKKVAEVDKDGNVSAVRPGTAEIEAKLENVTAVFEVTVKLKQIQDEEDVQADKEALAISYAAGDSAERVTQNIELPATGANGSQITWASSNEAYIKPDGSVTRPKPDEGDQQVTLTATLTKGAATAQKTFDLTVSKEIEQLTIATARTLEGQNVTIKGIVTADNAAIGGGKLSTFMQDQSAGINIFNQDPSQFPELAEGDELEVSGKITVYRGLTEIVPAAGGIRVLSKENELPEPRAIALADLTDSEIAEPLEGTLVEVTGFINQIPGSTAGGGYNLTLIDKDFKGVTLRIIQDSMDISQVQSDKWYKVTAIVGQFDNGYQLLPRKQEDLDLLPDQPDPPGQPGSYSSAIADVVDGDTVHLSQPVIGLTKVRYVNIDTAETYHSVRNDLDRNQKEHGERAKAYLKSLLPVDEEVTVQVGEEATDDYGRLLAEVTRKRDNLNTNLEMVQSGNAATYFIWPFDEAVYEPYSQAVKQAILDGKGIWNPYDPLLELPFEFRGREQGKGLTRYVGNFYTREYVAPEDFKAIPVEARVFFASAAEAEENGYDPMPADELADGLDVAADKAALQLDYDGTSPAISLPASGEKGTEITWSLRDPSQSDLVQLATGSVNRDGLSRDTTVILVATIKKGEASDEQGFPVLIKAETNTPPPVVADLLISEYLEGSSNNKAIEIYNGTENEIDLSAGGYALALYSNGSISPGNTFAFTGTLAAGATYVIANPSANAAILGKAQATSTVTYFNGDDALVLYKNYDAATKTGTVLDVIGAVGVDPGTAWGTTVKTVDQTLVRKSSVSAGNTQLNGPFDPALEWESKGIDYFDDLGRHLIQ